jgi:hypothetical protein
MAYTSIEGKTYYDLQNDLVEVFKNYPNDYPNFYEMVKKFADDNFYKLHFVAKEFLLVSFEDCADIPLVKELEKERKDNGF